MYAGRKLSNPLSVEEMDGASKMNDDEMIPSSLLQKIGFFLTQFLCHIKPLCT